jgi:hypothetical protein
MEKNFVDSHGQSEVAFAFCHLLGTVRLMACLKRIKDGAQNTHSRHPGNVTDNAVDLDIHLREGLLHALHQAIAILAFRVSRRRR